MRKIDIDNWARKEHYEFFSGMKSSYFGITADIDCTKAYLKARFDAVSFYAYYLFKAMMASNNIEEMKYRIIDGDVYCLDTLGIGSTAMRKDDTFSFIYMNYTTDFNLFYEEFKKEIEEVNNSTGLRRTDDHVAKNHVRCTVIPWLSFTSMLHSTHFDPTESVPNISFVKYDA